MFLKFCVLLNYSETISHKLLVKCVGNNALQKTAVHKWISSYKQGRTSAEDKPREGRPTSTTRLEARDKIKKALMETRRVSVSDLAAQLNIPHTTVYRTLTEDLGLVSRMATWVPHTLNDDQKLFRYEIARLNLNWYKREPDLLNRLICLDETWVEFYKPPQKHQSRSWVEPGGEPERIPMQKPHERKTLLAIGMDNHGIAFWKTYDYDCRTV